MCINTNQNSNNNNNVEQLYMNQSEVKQLVQQDSVAEALKDEVNVDEMQQLVAYINQFEKENISHAVNIVENSSYITLTPMQIAQLDKNMQQNLENETKSMVTEPALDIDLIESSRSKLRLSSSSLSSSGDSLGSIENTVQEEPVPDRRTYVINKIYDNLHNEMEETNTLNTKDFQQINMSDNDEYKKVIFKQQELESDYGEYNNDLLVKPASQDNPKIHKSTMSKSLFQTETADEHIYANVKAREETEARESMGFNVNSLILEKEQSDVNIESLGLERQSSSSQEFLDAEINNKMEETFDNELIELNNQIKKLLTNVESGLGDEAEKKCKKNNSFKRPKSKVTSPVTPNPPTPGHNHNKSDEFVKRRITMSSYPLNRPQDEQHIQLDQPRAKNKVHNSICKSISTDEIKGQQQQSQYMPNQSKTVRHSFRLNPLSNQSEKELNPKANQSELFDKSISKSLQDNSRISLKLKEKGVEKLNENLEVISVKSKIKLMEAFVSNPIPIGKSCNERSSSTSSAGLSSSSSSSSSSKSPPLSPHRGLDFKQTNKPPTVMARSNISQSYNTSASSCQNMPSPMASRSLNQLNNVSKPVEENCAIEGEWAEEVMISDDSLTQQAKSSLKEKRKTVKELMSKFEQK